MIRSLLPRALLALVLAVLCSAFSALSAQSPMVDWATEGSDLQPDPAFVLGQLPNGLRYIVRSNDTPQDQAEIRLLIRAGSLDETQDERGFAHFIEHMGFNGSENLPEGEMVALLERGGIAFGRDANATTSHEDTLFRLRLPTARPELIDDALMVLREAAGSLTFDGEAIEREKKIILSERRVRDTYRQRNSIDNLAFLYPGARFTERLPIGSAETVAGAGPEDLRAFWSRTYRPDNAALIVVGSIDPAEVEQQIAARFGDWASPAPATEQPSPGPIDPALAGQTDVYLDPSLPERVTIARHGAWLGEQDTAANRRTQLERTVGYRIVNRRFLRLARSKRPPFREASLSTRDVFEAARTTRLTVESSSGKWRQALLAAAGEYRRALSSGFTQAEVDEQLAIIRNALQRAAAASETRTHADLTAAALALLQDRRVPTAPESDLARFEAFAAEVTPETVMKALAAELVPLDDPLIRFQGATAPGGGAEALRAAWEEAMAGPLEPSRPAQDASFAYTEFGPPGAVVGDTVEPLLGIRTVRFANGVRLNMKRTDLERGQVRVEMNLDGGKMLDTKDDPLRTAMVPVLHYGGLGAHDYDELQTLLAGRNVGYRWAADEETFRISAVTTPGDLLLQFQLLAASLTDPGFRRQAAAQFRRDTSIFFARREATPANVVRNRAGEVLSDGDPRFSIPPEEAFRAKTLEQLRRAIGDRLEHGAIEIGLVGNFDEDRAIGAVAATLGALPPREAEFRPYAENRGRPFTSDRSARVLHHKGAADQALLRFTWRTTDDRDHPEHLRLELLERVVRIVLMETLREELGQTYTPGVNASQSQVHDGYGTFTIAAQVDAARIGDARTAMLGAVRRLLEQPVPSDILLRARTPLLEELDNALSTNAGWMNLVDRAQSRPEQIARFLSAPNTVEAITAAELQATAARYLDPGLAVEFVVVPEGAAPADKESHPET
ncbi:M16 family metallopeptidase [Croceibacterium soli]|uniref:M16 family metallopeptidase n=1 Tax=Croceibacterium soli TaxID=1739690 RepID=UPI002E25557B